MQIQRIPRPGETFSDATGTIFTVTGISFNGQDDKITINYRGNNKDYSCWAEAFVTRFTPCPEPEKV